MDIKVHRFEFGDTYTIGRMYLDGEYFCYTLEPKVQTPKVMGHTAIPVGTYTVTHDWSGHFSREMPLLVGVPDFSEVRIHPGNTDANTEGCILLGSTWAGGDFVGSSKQAFDSFWTRFLEAGAATITVE